MVRSVLISHPYHVQVGIIGQPLEPELEVALHGSLVQWRTTCVKGVAILPRKHRRDCRGHRSDISNCGRNVRVARCQCLEWRRGPGWMYRQHWSNCPGDSEHADRE